MKIKFLETVWRTMLLGHFRTHRSRSAQITYRRDNRHHIKALNPPDIKQAMKTGSNIRHHHQRCAVASQRSPAGRHHPVQVKGQIQLLLTHLLELVPERCKASKATRQRHFSQQQCRASSEAAVGTNSEGKLPLASTFLSNFTAQQTSAQPDLRWSAVMQRSRHLTSRRCR